MCCTNNMTCGYCNERGCSTPIWSPHIAKGRTHHRAIIRNGINLPVCYVEATLDPPPAIYMFPDDALTGTPTIPRVYTQDATVDTRRTKRREK